MCGSAPTPTAAARCSWARVGPSRANSSRDSVPTLSFIFSRSTPTRTASSPSHPNPSSSRSRTGLVTNEFPKELQVLRLLRGMKTVRAVEIQPAQPLPPPLTPGNFQDFPPRLFLGGKRIERVLFSIHNQNRARIGKSDQFRDMTFRVDVGNQEVDSQGARTVPGQHHLEVAGPA